jgi:hypothetical protein
MNNNKVINNQNQNLNQNQIIEKFSNISNKIILTKIDIKNIQILHLFFESVITNCYDFNKTYDIIFTFLKKINRNSNIDLLKIKNKLHDDEYNKNLINETNEKFINWILL